LIEFNRKYTFVVCHSIYTNDSTQQEIDMAEDNQRKANLELSSEEFITGLPEQWGAIETNWVRVRRNGWDSPDMYSLMQQLHSLAEVAETLGFEKIAKNSSQLQILLETKSNGNGWDGSESLFSKAESKMQALRQAAYSDQQMELAELPQGSTIPKYSSISLLEKRADRLIYMVEDDPIQAAELAEQISHFGYSAMGFRSLAELEEAMRQASPKALLIDVSSPEGKMWRYESLKELSEKFTELPPIIFISTKNRMPFRLEAVRAGGEAYFTKPVDVSMLVNSLDRLIFKDITPFPRVMIVDDSLIQANYMATQLKKVGVLTEVVSKPQAIIDQMTRFTPDLLLLDMYMPECTGMELAKAIRQIEQFASIPIIFLSAETNKNTQIAAMGLDGHDFLTKPLEPEHLISAITRRIECYRKLRKSMIRDGLTGLPNHSTTKQRLSQEIEHARQGDLALSLAMVDLDHFKKVNDTYGHATGDQVLRSLACMLKQRLRSNDVIGRIGGEEFAILLPNTNEETATRIMAELGEGFARVHHQTRGKKISVTFSCGVATYPDYDSAAELSKAANEALYAAKAAGRNQVVCASQAQGGIKPVAMADWQRNRRLKFNRRLKLSRRRKNGRRLTPSRRL
jgi:diguanylate cyclase (GGDEF)-like protein